MSTVVIANPHAGNGRVRRAWQQYFQVLRGLFGDFTHRFTSGPNDGTRLTRQAIEDGATRIVAVGGDGTLNEVVNGLFPMTGDTMLNPDVVLGVLPAGTGGDFCRSVGLDTKMHGLPLLGDCEERRVDLGRATIGHGESSATLYHFINISSFGSSGLIADQVNRTTKLMGGRASFFLGTVKGMLRYRNRLVRLRVDDVFDEEVIINMVAVANARFFGGSMKIAPNAIMDDGLFDVVIVGEIGAATFLRNAKSLYQGTHLDHPQIHHVRGKTVSATPLDGDVLIDLDGEQLGRLPVRYDVLPRAVKLFAPWKRAEAIGQRG